MGEDKAASPRSRLDERGVAPEPFWDGVESIAESIGLPSGACCWEGPEWVGVEVVEFLVGRPRRRAEEGEDMIRVLWSILSNLYLSVVHRMRRLLVVVKMGDRVLENRRVGARKVLQKKQARFCRFVATQKKAVAQ